MIRHYFVVLIFLFTASETWCQKITEDYFLEAQRAESDTSKLRIYKYIVDNHPTSKFCPESYYYIGNYYEKMGETRLMINAYREIVRLCGKPDKATIIPDFDPKARALTQLSELYEKVGDYDSALYFLYFADSAFTIFHGCGTGLDIERELNTARCANLLVKLNRVTDAEHVLLPMLEFKRRHNYNGEIGSAVSLTLKEIFKKYESPDTLKKLIDKAIDNYFLDTTYDEYRGKHNTLIYCGLYFQGIKIAYFYKSFPDPWQTEFDTSPQMAGLSERQMIIANLKQMELYLMIHEL